MNNRLTININSNTQNNIPKSNSSCDGFILSNQGEKVTTSPLLFPDSPQYVLELDHALDMERADESDQLYASDDSFSYDRHSEDNVPYNSPENNFALRPFALNYSSHRNVLFNQNRSPERDYPSEQNLMNINNNNNNNAASANWDTNRKNSRKRDEEIEESQKKFKTDASHSFRK